MPYPPVDPEQWLVQRLANIAQFNPRFESAWYGPYNALLSHYFPYQQYFLVKPQPKIRDADMHDEDISFSSTQAESSVVADALDEASSSAANLSLTSTGALVLSNAGSTYVPDFVVVKATQFATQDTPLLVVEVKLHEPMNDSDWVASEHQMDRYMDSLGSHMPRGSRLTGLLICGKKVKIFRWEGPKYGVKMDTMKRSINGKIVRNLLWNIATENWDYR
ncbi:hypothetical protein OG21DRAFT_1517028 [Imleria badia]|nr:hypothetical protein OG21DRAFT_1517028 [Imleria badia]